MAEVDVREMAMAYHQNEGQCEKLKEWLNVCGTHLGPGQRSAFSGRSAGMCKGCARDAQGAPILDP